MVHDGIKDFKCVYCGKAFSLRKDLKRHIHKVYEGHGDYKCVFCSKSFSDERNLKRHNHEGKGRLQM